MQNLGTEVPYFEKKRKNLAYNFFSRKFSSCLSENCNFDCPPQPASPLNIFSLRRRRLRPTYCVLWYVVYSECLHADCRRCLNVAVCWIADAAAATRHHPRTTSTLTTIQTQQQKMMLSDPCDEQHRRAGCFWSPAHLLHHVTTRCHVTSSPTSSIN